MSSLKTFLSCIAFFISINVFAQNGKILKDAGFKKLSVFTGTWKAQNDANYKDRISAVTKCRISENGNFLICDQNVSKKDGISNNLAIYSYDSLNHYTLTLVGIKGMDPFSISVLSDGDTLTYPGSYTDNGVKVYARTLNIFENPHSYKYLVQSSKDGKNWNTTIAGNAIKINE